jgi:hypothetical protein
MTSQPRILNAEVHYGTPTVHVEPYRITDRYGDEYEITYFWLNGPGWPQAAGFKIRKDGLRANRRLQNIDVAKPANVVAALTALDATT